MPGWSFVSIILSIVIHRYNYSLPIKLGKNKLHSVQVLVIDIPTLNHWRDSVILFLLLREDTHFVLIDTIYLNSIRMPSTTSAMMSCDLDELLSEFNSKIGLVEDLMPLARSCQSAMSQETSGSRFDKWSLDKKSSGTNGQQDKEMLDLEELTQMVLDMKDIMADSKNKLNNAQMLMDEQESRIKIRIDSLKSHLKYLRSNVPQFLQTKEDTEELMRGSVNGPNGAKKGTVVRNVVTGATNKKAGISGVNKNGSGGSGGPMLKSGSSSGLTTAGKVVRSNSQKTLSQAPSTVYKKRVDIKSVPKIDFLTVDEFESIPTYVLYFVDSS